MSALDISVADPSTEEIRELLEQHLAFARANTPPEYVHALDVDGLLDPAITFYVVRRDGVLVGVGALKQLNPQHYELKSIHTALTARGSGVAAALVRHLVDVARRRGAGSVSLETGSQAAFAPARRLFARCGFVVCTPFSDYQTNPSSFFMTRELSATAD